MRRGISCSKKLISGDAGRVINFTLWKLYIISFIISIMGVFFYDNATVTYIVVAVQVATLTYCFFRKKFVDYMGLYIQYTGLSLEFKQFLRTDELYSFKETRICGINLGVLMLVPVALYALISRIVKKQCRVKKNSMHRFIIFYCLTWGIAIAMGVIVSAVNDNDVKKYFDMTKTIIIEAYERGAQPLLLFAVFAFLLIDKKEFEKLEMYFEVTLGGCVFYMLISCLSNRFGYYGGVDTLIVPNNVRWLPLLLLLPFYEKYKKLPRIWILAIAGAYFSLRYNATGKTVILYALIPFIWLLCWVVNREWKKVCGWIALLPAVIFGGLLAIKKLSETSILFRSKLKQAQSLIIGLFTGSTKVVLDSPLKRFEEIENIILEYLEKPQLMLLGKGMGGTFIDRIGMSYSLSDYSEIECSSAIFMNVHETLAKLLLSCGILGMFFMIWVIVNGMKKFSISPWVVLGVYWFLISYGYSITMTAMGIPCLLYGLYQSKSNSEYCVDILFSCDERTRK